MTLPVLVPDPLLSSLDDALRIAEYLLSFNRYEVTPEYLAHAETGVARLRTMAAELVALRAEDDRMRAEEQERFDAAERKKGNNPWLKF